MNQYLEVVSNFGVGDNRKQCTKECGHYWCKSANGVRKTITFWWRVSETIGNLHCNPAKSNVTSTLKRFTSMIISTHSIHIDITFSKCQVLITLFGFTLVNKKGMQVWLELLSSHWHHFISKY